jgi:molybdopterin converting factor subunit 1
MEVTTRYFAIVRERAGRSSERLCVEEGAGLEQLWQRVVDAHVGLRELRSAMRFAVNGAYAGADTILHEGDEVAFLPPMSGGSGR